MSDLYTDIDLCEALSDIFVDNETNCWQIAFIAQHFPIQHVETVYFEWVALVCYGNTQTPSNFCMDRV